MPNLTLDYQLWEEKSYAHPTLQGLLPQVGTLLATSKAPSTMQRYGDAWRRFRGWCSGVSMPFLPAEPLLVALYVIMLAQLGLSESTLKIHLAAISAFHQMSGFASPAGSELMSLIQSALKRQLPRQVNRKEPLLWEHVQRIAAKKVYALCPLADLMVTAAIRLSSFCILAI